MEPLLSSLRKKDSDLEVIELSNDGAVVRTILEIGDILQEPEDQRFNQASLPPSINVNTQIVRHLFTHHAFLSFMIPSFGIVPFYLLKDHWSISLELFALSFFSSIVLYVTMYLVRDDDWASYAFCMWMFNNYILICSLSAVLHSIAPFQACFILFINSLMIIIIGLWFERLIDPWWISLFLVIGGAIVWGTGIYAFIKEQDWITSGVLFIVSVVFIPFYCGYEIHLINSGRFHKNEMGRVIVYFWVDPIIQLATKLAKRVLN